MKLILLLLSFPAFASYMPGTVMSTTGSSLNGSSVVKLEYAYINNVGACTLSTHSGFVQSVSRPGTGRCNIVFYSGIFSTTPSCVCSPHISDSRYACIIYDQGAGEVTTSTFTTNGPTADDVPINVHCVGSK